MYAFVFVLMMLFIILWLILLILGVVYYRDNLRHSKWGTPIFYVAFCAWVSLFVLAAPHIVPEKYKAKAVTKMVCEERTVYVFDEE